MRIFQRSTTERMNGKSLMSWDRALIGDDFMWIVEPIANRIFHRRRIRLRERIPSTLKCHILSNSDSICKQKQLAHDPLVMCILKLQDWLVYHTPSANTISKRKHHILLTGDSVAIKTELAKYSFVYSFAVTL